MSAPGPQATVAPTLTVRAARSQDGAVSGGGRMLIRLDGQKQASFGPSAPDNVIQSSETPAVSPRQAVRGRESGSQSGRCSRWWVGRLPCQDLCPAGPPPHLLPAPPSSCVTQKQTRSEVRLERVVVRSGLPQSQRPRGPGSAARELSPGIRRSAAHAEAGGDGRRLEDQQADRGTLPSPSAFSFCGGRHRVGQGPPSPDTPTAELNQMSRGGSLAQGAAVTPGRRS